VADHESRKILLSVVIVGYKFFRETSDHLLCNSLALSVDPESGFLRLDGVLTTSLSHCFLYSFIAVLTRICLRSKLNIKLSCSVIQYLTFDFMRSIDNSLQLPIVFSVLLYRKTTCNLDFLTIMVRTRVF